jgi:Transposase DDE domain group 1
MTEATPFLPGLSPLRRKPLTAERDAGNLTSNGGLVLLRESALRSGVAAVVADAVPDRRNPLLVVHSYRAMVTARMMAIAAGHEDADDLDALRFDPALMLACNREPEGGHGLPSQPTISRLENVPDARTLYKIGIGYIDFFCRSYASCRRHASSMTPTSIVLDIDDTDDLVRHGGAMLRMDAASNWHCSTPMPAATASSRSTSSRVTPASRSCRSCVPASGPRARRSRACSGT